MALAVLRKSVHYPRRDMFLLLLFLLLSQPKKTISRGWWNGVHVRAELRGTLVGTEGWHMLFGKITKTYQIVYRTSIMYMIRCGIDDFIKF